MPPLPERNLNTAPISQTASGGLLGLEGGALVIVPDVLGAARLAVTQARAAQAQAEAAANMLLALLNGGQLPTPGGGPVVTAQPYFSPSTGMRVGDTVTLNFGSAAGTPTPTRTWTLRRGTVDVSSQVVNGQFTFDTAGDYTLAVSWSNGHGLPVQAMAAVITVAALTPGAIAVTAQPSFSPSTGLQVGSTATLNFGTAAGTPTPTRTWTLRRGTVDVTAQVLNNQITFDTVGTYTLAVTWSNGIGQPVQATSATINVAAATGGTEVAPVVTVQPSFSPATGRRVGDTVTLNFGAASGTPTPTRTWTLRRGSVDVTAQVANGQITFATAGTYTLDVTWSNGVGSPVQATTASIIVAAAPVVTPWQATGGTNELTITAMPTPAPLALTGGLNEITIGN